MTNNPQVRHGDSSLGNTLLAWTRVEGMLDFTVMPMGNLGTYVSCCGTRVLVQRKEKGSIGNVTGETCWKVWDIDHHAYIAPEGNGSKSFGSSRETTEYVLHYMLDARIEESRRVIPAVRY